MVGNYGERKKLTMVNVDQLGLEICGGKFVVGNSWRESREIHYGAFSESLHEGADRACAVEHARTNF